MNNNQATFKNLFLSLHGLHEASVLHWALLNKHAVRESPAVLVSLQSQGH